MSPHLHREAVARSAGTPGKALMFSALKVWLAKSLSGYSVCCASF